MVIILQVLDSHKPYVKTLNQTKSIFLLLAFTYTDSPNLIFKRYTINMFIFTIFFFCIFFTQLFPFPVENDEVSKTDCLILRDIAIMFPNVRLLSHKTL